MKNTQRLMAVCGAVWMISTACGMDDPSEGAGRGQNGSHASKAFEGLFQVCHGFECRDRDFNDFVESTYDFGDQFPYIYESDDSGGTLKTVFRSMVYIKGNTISRIKQCGQNNDAPYGLVDDGSYYTFNISDSNNITFIDSDPDISAPYEFYWEDDMIVFPELGRIRKLAWDYQMVVNENPAEGEWCSHRLQVSSSN